MGFIIENNQAKCHSSSQAFNEALIIKEVYGVLKLD